MLHEANLMALKMVMDGNVDIKPSLEQFRGMMKMFDIYIAELNTMANLRLMRRDGTEKEYLEDYWYCVGIQAKLDELSKNRTIVPYSE